MSTEQTTLANPEETEPPRPDGACINFAECGNLPPGHPESSNGICDECLDAARRGGRGHDAPN